MLTSKVAIVGGGPVGLLGCLLLEKFKIDYVCLEKS
jgi:2-polyprenyl-6-methoxyphenol hydroxylase-like FAD-dependent oxidoreductase